MPRAIQRFEVSLKAFVVQGDRALFVRERDTGYWELPGGRIDVGEEMVDHADILAREIDEELGGAVRIQFGDAVVTWTREQPQDGRFVFLIARVGRLLSGDLELSEEHDDFLWASAAASHHLRFPPRSGYATAVAALWRSVPPLPNRTVVGP